MGDNRDQDFSISTSDKFAMLALARDSILTHFSNEEPGKDTTGRFTGTHGVFVSLHKHGALRGCVGFPEAIGPLSTAIVEAARAAAFQDSRFMPVKKNEMQDIDIEISVLSQPQKLEVTDPDDYPEKIKIDVDGLILRSTWSSALLLPQVASSNGFDAEAFLRCLCRKAGIPENSWKDPANTIYTFTASVFSEKELPEAPK